MAALNYSHPDTKHIAPSFGFGISTRSLHDLLDYLAAHNEHLEIKSDIPPALHGYCYVCQSDQVFEVEIINGGVNWRETLRCDGCGLINRWRSSVHLFESLCQPNDQTTVYITEAITPLYTLLKDRYPLTVGSEYVEGRSSGEELEARGKTVLIQDVTSLSFDKQSFNAILTFDVLEHVPDYMTALEEFFRVLKPSGRLLISVPFSFADKTLIRATIQPDGNLQHHLPALYHGDPLSDDGVLCFQSFGMDLLQQMTDIGFINSRVCCFSDRAAGYMDRNILYVAQKPGRLRALYRSALGLFRFSKRNSPKR